MSIYGTGRSYTLTFDDARLQPSRRMSCLTILSRKSAFPVKNKLSVNTPLQPKRFGFCTSSPVNESMPSCSVPFLQEESKVKKARASVALKKVNVLPPRLVCSPALITSEKLPAGRKRGLPVPSTSSIPSTSRQLRSGCNVGASEVSSQRSRYSMVTETFPHKRSKMSTESEDEPIAARLRRRNRIFHMEM
ncbi:unnamed protein product [Heterobilharzia americana]|nr:unnamed protein product [Heterobilharzia americana]